MTGLDPWEGAAVRRVQPYEAAKTYLCPGCDQEIPPGLGHVVAVPPEHPEDRRHWHRSCWERRSRRGPSGKRKR